MSTTNNQQINPRELCVQKLKEFLNDDNWTCFNKYNRNHENENEYLLNSLFSNDNISRLIVIYGLNLQTLPASTLNNSEQLFILSSFGKVKYCQDN